MKNFALPVLLLAPGLALAQESAAELRHRLETTRLSIDLDQAPIEEFLDYLSDVTGVNIVLHPTVVAEQDAQRHGVCLQARDISARDALALVLDLNRLDAAYRDGVLLVTRKEDARHETFSRSYDIRDLLFVIRDFPGPDISLTQGSGSDCLGVLISEVDGPEDDLTQPDVVVELVQENVAPGTWDQEGRSIACRSGHLVVRQTAEVHEEVERMLDLLRAHK